MFYFKKKIAYFDYYENGEKKRSCGHVKFIVKEDKVTIELHIKGIDARESCMCDIVAIGEEESRIGRFVIDKGTGYYSTCCSNENLNGEGLSLFSVTGLRLVISEEKYCQTVWEWEKIPEKSETEKISAADGQSERKEKEPEKKEPESGKEWTPEKEEVSEREKGWTPEKEETAEAEEALHKQQIARLVNKGTEWEEDSRAQEPDRMPEQGKEPVQREESSGREQVQEQLYEDKWQQLCSTYPVCHPFGEEEEYITITPKDFIVLRKEYQNLVSNSFLLHSFYNYHHVILGRMGKQDEIYYIGAPGNYFDREKKVAVMFGFEGFARSETGNKQRNENGLVACGDFGYYMKKVEI